MEAARLDQPMCQNYIDSTSNILLIVCLIAASTGSSLLLFTIFFISNCLNCLRARPMKEEKCDKKKKEGKNPKRKKVIEKTALELNKNFVFSFLLLTTLSISSQLAALILQFPIIDDNPWHSIP